MRIFTILVFVVLTAAVEAQSNVFNDTLKRSLDTLAVKEMPGVVVKSTKPFYQFTAEGIVFNLAETPMVKGSTVWNVLKKLPLLEADQKSGVKIYGIQNAFIYINGRMVNFSSDELYNYLNGMPSGNIVRIEVLTSPSSKYDAAAGGIVNIVLRRTEEDGLKGNIDQSWEQRRYGTYAGNLFLNFHWHKFTQTLTAYAGNEKLLVTQELANAYKTGSAETVETSSRNRNNYAGASTMIEYALDERQSIGGVFGYVRNNRENIADGAAAFIQGMSRSSYYIYNPVMDVTHDVLGNLNYRFFDEKKDRSLELNLDLTRQKTDNHFFYATGTLPGPADTWTSGNILISMPDISYHSVKMDYSSKLGKKGASMELGLKYQDNRFLSPLDAQKWNQVQWVNDTAQTNYFRYAEQISAAYLNISQTVCKQLQLKYGARIEQTHITATQDAGQQKNKHSYSNVLPFFSLNTALNKNSNLRLAVTSGIDRPYFSQLNTFIYKTSDHYWSSGNPDLFASRRMGVDLTYMYKRKYVFYVRDFRITDFIQENQALIASDVVLTRPLNLDGYGNILIVGNSFEKNFGEHARFVVFNNFSFFRQKIKNIPSTLPASSFYYTCNLQIGLKNIFGSGVDLDSWSRFRTRQRLLDVSVKPTANVNLSLQRSFTKQNLLLTLAFSDILKKANTYFERVTDAGVFGNLSYYDTRSVRITVTYNFGSSKIREAQERASENGTDRMSKPPRSGGL